MDERLLRLAGFAVYYAIGVVLGEVVRRGERVPARVFWGNGGNYIMAAMWPIPVVLMLAASC